MNNKTFGYVRVSDKDQNEERQVYKMKELGIDERDIYIDKRSGKNLERENYQLLRKMIREGDLVYLDDLDRLGRNYDDILNEWKYITRTLKADIVILSKRELFDSRKFKEMGDFGKLFEDQFLGLLSYMAEQERLKTLRRQKEGIEAAKRAGKHLGRNPIELTDEQKQILKENYSDWKVGLVTGVKFAEMLGLKKNTFYRIIKEYEQTLENMESEIK